MRTLSVKRKHKDGASISLHSGVYLVWAYVPESWLHALGITYYPSRYWAVAIPSYVIVTVVFILALYTSLNFIFTPPPQSLYALCDDHTRPNQNVVLSCGFDGEECLTIRPHSDIPITEVNALLLGPAFEQGLKRSYFREVQGL